jgi:transcriptional regulator with XRE-family HTH domain
MKTSVELYIIKQIKEKRVTAKISQKELATKLGVSPGFIGQVETNNYTTKYNFNHLNHLAKIFECSPRDFLPEKPIS